MENTIHFFILYMVKNNENFNNIAVSQLQYYKDIYFSVLILFVVYIGLEVCNIDHALDNLCKIEH